MTIAFRPEVADLLDELSKLEERSKVAELMYLDVERAKQLGLAASTTGAKG